jgi:RNA polymerase sigma factor (sigma-70 family)
MAMSETRISLLIRIRNLGDGRSWGEFDAIYRPLIFGYLHGLGIKGDDADDLTQEVFRRLMARLPKFELDRRRARFRTYLWKVTYSTLVDRARRRKVRDRAEQEWARAFCEADAARSREQKRIFLDKHRQRILEVALPRARARVSALAWACFEGRLVHRRPATEIATKLGIMKNSVFVHSSRVLKEVQRCCAEIEGEPGHENDDFLSG